MNLKLVIKIDAHAEPLTLASQWVKRAIAFLDDAGIDSPQANAIAPKWHPLNWGARGVEYGFMESGRFPGASHFTPELFRLVSACLLFDGCSRVNECLEKKDMEGLWRGLYWVCRFAWNFERYETGEEKSAKEKQIRSAAAKKAALAKNAPYREMEALAIAAFKDGNYRSAKNAGEKLSNRNGGPIHATPEVIRDWIYKYKKQKRSQ